MTTAQEWTWGEGCVFKNGVQELRSLQQENGVQELRSLQQETVVLYKF
jgi:hypothetical protein